MKEQNAQKQGGDGKLGGVSMRKETAQIQMGVSKTCGRGLGLSFIWKNAVSGLGLGWKIKLSKTPPSGRWGSNNHETIFVGEWEWELFIYSFILMLIMAF